MKMRFLLAACLVGLAGCAKTADTFALNDAAKRLGPVHVSYTAYGIGHGPVTITMADGEVLTGKYQVAYGASEAIAFSGAHVTSAVVVSGNGQLQFVATGPKTQMLCRGTNTASGHGNGQCQTYDGAAWAIDW